MSAKNGPVETTTDFDADDGSAWGRATRLLPLTLASASTVEMKQLADTIEQMGIAREGVGPMPSFNSLTVRPGARHFPYWAEISFGRLMWAVANATTINGGPIGAARLEVEREDLAMILNKLMDAGTEEGEPPTIEELLQRRLLQARHDVRVVLDRERNVTRLVPAGHADLGVLNTLLLLDLFAEYPITALTRCKLVACRRYFVPASVGRTRTRGVEFCSDACKRRWNNDLRKAKGVRG